MAVGAVAVPAVAGGGGLAAVVVCGSGMLCGIVLACGSVTSSSPAVLLPGWGRLRRGAGCAARYRLLLGEAVAVLLVTWLEEVF